MGHPCLREPLNTKIWNNEQVEKTSGYSLKDISVCLFKLGKFIKSNLKPNKLEKFNLNTL